MEAPPPAVAAAASPGALWIVDLDGVIWLSGRPIGDAGGAVAALQRAGIRVAFATNNSSVTSAALVERLRRIGVDVSPGEIVSSAEAAASLLEPGQAATVLAEDGGGVVEALHGRGVAVTTSGPVDAAVVGWSRSFDFAGLAAAADAARQSGRLIGTNEDPAHPTPEGLVPGTGALLAAVATASGVAAEIAGKPHGPMVSLVRAKLGVGEGGPPAMVVGDQPRTDGQLAQYLGIPFALVDSGVTPPGAAVGDVPVAARAADFAALVAGLGLDGRLRG